MTTEVGDSGALLHGSGGTKFFFRFLGTLACKNSDKLVKFTYKDSAMKATEIALHRFMDARDARFVIPVYQRNYSWKREQCAQLLNDIRLVGGNNVIPEHFIGSVVYVHEGSARDRRMLIVDGQQRLTTVTLLFLALARTTGNPDLARELMERYLINKEGSGPVEEKLKLRPAEENDRALRHLLLRGGEGYDGFSRLVDNYHFLEQEVAGLDSHVVRNGLERLSIVEIALDPQDNPQRIFESMNSTGLALSQADLIRNYILMNLPEKEQNRVYNDFWCGIEEFARDDSVQEDRVTQFVRHFLTVKERKIPSLHLVYSAFKKWGPQLTVSNRLAPEMESALQEMRSLARFYGMLLNPSREEDPEIRRHLEFLKRIEVDVSHPFLLEAYRDYGNARISRDDFVRTLEIVQSHTWRRFVVGLPTAGVNKTFMTLYQSVNVEDYFPSLQRALRKRTGKQRFPDDGEVRRELEVKDIYNIKRFNLNYFLERLENCGTSEPVEVNAPSVTVEHIFPQKPSREWLNEFGEEEETWMRERVHTIANLALSGNNGALANRPFREKREMNKDDGRQGYRFSNFPRTRMLAELDKWGKDEMTARMEDVWRKFVEIWPFPDVEVDQGDEYVDIFEVDTLAHMRLDGFIFDNQAHPRCSVNEMYQTVVGLLFDLAPERFLGNGILGGALGTRIRLTKNRDELNQASSRPLGDGYYHELARGNDDKLATLKSLLTDFGLQDDLQLKFRRD